MHLRSRWTEHEAFAGRSVLYRVCVTRLEGEEPNVLGPFPDLGAALASAGRVPAGHRGMWVERAAWERVLSPVDEW